MIMIMIALLLKNEKQFIFFDKIAIMIAVHMKNEKQFIFFERIAIMWRIRNSSFFFKRTTIMVAISVKNEKQVIFWKNCDYDRIPSEEWETIHFLQGLHHGRSPIKKQ